jgi:hypothetical protein
MKKMKKIIVLAFLFTNLILVESQTYQFRKPTSPSTNTWKFSNVKSNTDAYISIVGSQNASLDRIDDSSRYVSAWNPFIEFDRSSNSNTFSYVEFLIVFRKRNSTTLDTQSNLYMTIVDLDGSNSTSGNDVFRETVQASKPATPTSSGLTDIAHTENHDWFTFTSGIGVYDPIDTSNHGAMIQLNYSNVDSFRVRVGVTGKISRNSVREYSFYFKSFSTLYTLLNFEEVSETIKEKTNIEDDEEIIEVYNISRQKIFVGYKKDFLLQAEKQTIYIIKDFKFIIQ